MKLKILVQILAAATVIASMTGCASPYMVDRGRDVADVFTIAQGLGYGVKVRVGPIHAGVIAFFGDNGLFAGDIVDCYGHPPVGSELFGMGDEKMYPRLAHGLESTGRVEAKGYHAESDTIPFITTDFKPGNASPQFPHPYWTQVEIQLGICASLRLGFNPGELLDFILGWTTIDIFNDDFEIRNQKEKSNPAPENVDAAVQNEEPKNTIKMAPRDTRSEYDRIADDMIKERDEEKRHIEQDRMQSNPAPDNIVTNAPDVDTRN